MKTVLCFGDSLTWGYMAGSATRHPFENRWPSVLGEELGTDKVRIIAEGLNGRTTVFDDFSNPADMNGARVLPTILASHSPLDCVVIMLGTNDMKRFVSGSAIAAARGMQRLAEIVKTHRYSIDGSVPQIVLVAPPAIVETGDVEMREVFAGGVLESEKLAKYYRRTAVEMACTFFDAGTIASATPVDGVHLDTQNTRAVGTALAPIIAQLLDL